MKGTFGEPLMNGAALEFFMRGQVVVQLKALIMRRLHDPNVIRYKSTKAGLCTMK